MSKTAATKQARNETAVIQVGDRQWQINTWDGDRGAWRSGIQSLSWWAALDYQREWRAERIAALTIKEID